LNLGPHLNDYGNPQVQPNWAFRILLYGEKHFRELKGLPTDFFKPSSDWFPQALQLIRFEGSHHGIESRDLCQQREELLGGNGKA
jgi:hypothetical protein